jgi:glycosyltransferase involved in cell wall biosynthesis
LAERIGSVLGRPYEAAKSAYQEDKVAELWIDWVKRQEEGNARVAAVATPAVLRSASDTLAVVVTHYERPSLIFRTLESLALQTDLAFELILVDDGSTSEAALQALDEIGRRTWPFRLKALRRENGYLGAARNTGIRATDARRLIFIDDDNIAFPSLIATLRQAIENTAADIITCQMLIFRETFGEPDLDLLDQGERWAFTGGPQELGLSLNCFGDATGVYRREVFERVGFFHEWRGIGHEDWHLYARAALAGLSIVSLPVPLYWYRRVPTGMLQSTDRYANNKIIWDVYRSAIPPNLRRFVDLSIRNDLAD